MWNKPQLSLDFVKSPVSILSVSAIFGKYVKEPLFVTFEEKIKMVPTCRIALFHGTDMFMSNICGIFLEMDSIWDIIGCYTAGWKEDWLGGVWNKIRLN